MPSLCRFQTLAISPFFSGVLSMLLKTNAIFDLSPLPCRVCCSYTRGKCDMEQLMWHKDLATVAHLVMGCFDHDMLDAADDDCLSIPFCQP